MFPKQEITPVFQPHLDKAPLDGAIVNKKLTKGEPNMLHQ